ncbi:hypothetical protein NXF25_001289 [Crotalus adamanteus]|uniref:Uncharacterized protein n=1 Tax=Crotalus adamanteus TaxID=8729 RepID=A0AAW1C6I2_CROAD
MFLGYESSKQEANVLHLLFLYDLKLYAKSSGEIHILLDTVKTFSDDIKMVFGLKKSFQSKLNDGNTKSNNAKLSLPYAVQQILLTGFRWN